LDSSLVRTAGSDRAGGHDKVLIVDFGSQVTQLIARRVREEKVYCEIVPFQKAEEAFKAMRPKAVIFSGGPASVLDQGAPLAPRCCATSCARLPAAAAIGPCARSRRKRSRRSARRSGAPA